ncbi:MAG: hypothetical protein WC475_05010 [Candidatus Paceibacterota bacterium]
MGKSKSIDTTIEGKVNEIAVTEGISSNSLRKAIYGADLENPLDIQRVAHVIKAYGASSCKISSLLKQGCSVSDVCSLYEINRQYSFSNPVSMKSILGFWKAAYGNEEINPELMTHYLEKIAGIEMNENALNTRLKKIAEYMEMNPEKTMKDPDFALALLDGDITRTGD